MPASSGSLVLHQIRQDREARSFRQDLLAAEDAQRQLREMRERLRRATELYRQRLEARPHERERGA